MRTIISWAFLYFATAAFFFARSASFSCSRATISFSMFSNCEMSSLQPAPLAGRHDAGSPPSNRLRQLPVLAFLRGGGDKVSSSNDEPASLSSTVEEKRRAPPLLRPSGGPGGAVVAIRAPVLPFAAPGVGCLATWPSSCAPCTPCGDTGYVDLRVDSTEVPGTCVVAWLAFSLTVGEKRTFSSPRVGCLPCPASCFA
eukprot:SAG11_NODE_2778_length_2981_cov_9.804303_1_plen_198_part_00